MKNFIIDINGTLTKHDASMNPDFERWMYDFCLNHKVILTTGASIHAARRATRTLTKRAHFVSCRSDNLRYKNNELILKRPATVFKGELIDYLQERQLTFRFNDDYILNVMSKPGTRHNIIYDIEDNFPDYVAFACNNLSTVDILKADRDKTQLLEEVNSDTIFITDGSDYPRYDYSLASKIKEVVKVIDYNDTWDYLRDKYNYEESTNIRS